MHPSTMGDRTRRLSTNTFCMSRVSRSEMVKSEQKCGPVGSRMRERSGGGGVRTLLCVLFDVVGFTQGFTLLLSYMTPAVHSLRHQLAPPLSAPSTSSLVAPPSFSSIK
eukprot:GHVS01073401.1.p3 GENE.GHVS01073401.1~~GHVS01073401.1.p3  ORF type:complete len:109 (+),score=22.21 GHVS01073401.1:1407-1733(+)